jgi:hypothetical protein
MRNCTNVLTQRVLNDLQRARLFCGRMIQLHAHSLPPSPVGTWAVFLSLPVCNRLSLRGSGEGMGVEPKSYDRKKAWPSIYHSILSGFDVYVWETCLHTIPLKFHFFSHAQKYYFFAYKRVAKIMLSFPLLSHQIFNYYLQGRL